MASGVPWGLEERRALDLPCLTGPLNEIELSKRARSRPLLCCHEETDAARCTEGRLIKLDGEKTIILAEKAGAGLPG